MELSTLLSLDSLTLSVVANVRHLTPQAGFDEKDLNQFDEELEHHRAKMAEQDQLSNEVDDKEGKILIDFVVSQPKGQLIWICHDNL